MRRLMNWALKCVMLCARARSLPISIPGAGDYVRAHGEVFEGINPVTSAVEAKLTTPGMMVEIEADALIHDEIGTVNY